jgi:hypothetical protein
MKKNLLLIISLLPLLALGQDLIKKGDISIHITGNEQNYNDKLLIDIYKRSNTIKIVYAVLDSVKNNQMELDTAFTNSRKKFFKYVESFGTVSQEKVDKGNILSNKYKAFVRRYSVYYSDSVTLSSKKDTAYNNLFIRIAKASREDLEQTAYNKKFVKMHSLLIEFTVADESGVKQAYTNSPNATSNPLLYALLSQTLSICRARNTSILLPGFYGNY